MQYKNMKQLIIKCLSILFLSSCFTYQSSAQLVTTAVNATDADLLVTTLLGDNIEFDNAILITDNVEENSRSAGTFTDGNSTNIGLDRGIILTSGDVSIAIGPNDEAGASANNNAPGDPAIANSRDATVLQFDFTPNETSLSFRYVFASEEYPEYACSEFNDAFGFFLTGDNPNGPDYDSENIALLPNSDTVAIRNVNDQQCIVGEDNNTDLYISNPEGPNTTIQYDGFTTVLTVEVDVVACQTYTIRLVIADRTDRFFDSAVFLEEGSFTAVTPQEADFTFTDETGNAQSQFCFGEPILLDATSSAVSESWFFQIEEFDGGFPGNQAPLRFCTTNTRTDALGVLNMIELWASCEWQEGVANEFVPGRYYVVTLVLTDLCGNQETQTQTFSFICCESEENCTARFTLNSTENPDNTATISTNDVPASNNPWSQSNWFLFTHEQLGQGPYTPVTSANSDGFEFVAEFGICYTLVHQIVSDCGTCCYAREICQDAKGKVLISESDELTKIDCGDLDLGFCSLNTPTGLDCESTGKVLQLNWDEVLGADGYLVDVFINDPKCCSNQGPGSPFPGGGQSQVQYETTTNSVLTEIEDGSCFSWQVTAICNGGQSSNPSERICTSGFCRVGSDDSGLDDIIIKPRIQLNGDQIEVYPNPTSEVVNFAVTMKNTSTDASINIYDTNYRLVETITDFNHTGNMISGKWQIDNKINNGVYILEVVLDHGVITERILVAK